MTKLIVCSDTVLTNSWKLKYNCKLLRHFIDENNRFLLTTKRSIREVRDEYEKLGIQYTDLSCSNGLLLYNGNNILARSTSVNHEVVSALRRSLQNDENIHIWTEAPLSTNGCAPAKAIIGIFDGKNCYDSEQRVGKAIRDVQKKGARIKHNIMPYEEGRYYEMFEVRSSLATEERQIMNIMVQHNIAEEDVMDLRDEQPRRLSRRIRAFMRKK